MTIVAKLLLWMYAATSIGLLALLLFPANRRALEHRADWPRIHHMPRSERHPRSMEVH